MKTFLLGVAEGMGSAVGLVVVGAVALVVGTPKGRKVLRSLAVSVVAATMKAADGVRAMTRDAREDLKEIVQEAEGRRKVHQHRHSPAVQDGMVHTPEVTL